MKRNVALCWLALLLLAAGSLLYRVNEGLHFKTDLLALLPRAEQDPDLQRVNDTVVHDLSRKIFILVGDPDRDVARAAAQQMSDALTKAGLVTVTASSFTKDKIRALGEFYAPYRGGLLADNDRADLEQGKANEVASRALAEVYGFEGLANAKLLAKDPFLLLPKFFLNLPVPFSNLTLDDGMLSTVQDGKTWILIAGKTVGEPYALDIQKQVADLFDDLRRKEVAQYPTLEIVHLGAVFFANAGAAEAMNETSLLGSISTVGTLLLVLLIFRATGPLLLSFLVIATGILFALAGSLWIFGDLHAIALLFGVSLIGVSVDYSLQYCTEIFAPNFEGPHTRLQKVFVGITIGTATTVIGYLTLLLAPFPGLRQIATFSALGLTGSWLTVVLWLPYLDRMKPARHGIPLSEGINRFLDFWENAQCQKARRATIFCCLVIVAVGVAFFRPDDNIRHLQSLAPDLVAEQTRLQNIIGRSEDNQFFVVQGKTEEIVLEREEALMGALQGAIQDHDITGYEALAAFVPSTERQEANRRLVATKLYGPLLEPQTAKLNLTEAPTAPASDAPFLKVDDAVKPGGALETLSALRLQGPDGQIMHMVSLDGVKSVAGLRDLTKPIRGVRLIDPAGDFGALLTKYRRQALGLLALSALLMVPLLGWRYGFKKGLWIMVPPALAVALAVAVRSIFGGTFTFFDAMALVLTLSIGVDYSVFCAETSGERKPVTLLAVSMAAATAILSFGLLALSAVSAVHSFGLTMLLGIFFAFLLAPMARTEKL